MIFGKNVTKCCGQCANCVPVAGTNTMLCKRKGVVTASYKCRKFEYDPLKKVPVVRMVTTSFSKQDFSL